MEIWKDIEGYEGLYQVSNMGRIKSLGNNKNRKEKILKSSHQTQGYLMVVLSKKGKQKAFYIHRLVAENFLPNLNNLPEVNHIDENKENNTVYNLEWCTHDYNMNYGSRNKRSANKHIKKILCIETNEIFNGAKDVINRMFNGKGSVSNINAHLKGRQKTAYKYHFKYIE